MSDTKATSRLVLSWVPVVDARGRTHLEARWLPDSPTSTPADVRHAA